MHVHVSHPDGEAKFWLKPAVELATQAGLPDHLVGEARNVSMTLRHLRNEFSVAG